jgi:ribose 1,5-bisphosphokinase PhnN
MANRKLTSRLFIIAGNVSSGKDKIISAVRELGALHAQVVTKYTTRKETEDDGSELVCKIDKDGKPNPIFLKKFDKCDISYERNNNTYRIDSSEIWDAMKTGLFQVVSVTEAGPINQLKTKFGSSVVLIYVHSDSEEPPEELSLFVDNFDKFDHVLIYEKNYEDLYDQLFRLFRAYEREFIK